MDPRDEARRLIVLGDSRQKHGLSSGARARDAYEQALAVVREHGLEQRLAELIEQRLSDLDAGSGPGVSG